MLRTHLTLPLAAIAITACTATLPNASGSNGAALYQKHCTSCHGTTAQGDGPLARGFEPPPADLTLLSDRNGGTFPIMDVMAQINGYTGRHQTGGMPEFEEVIKSPMVNWTAPSGDVIPTPQALLALATYLESIQK